MQPVAVGVALARQPVVVRGAARPATSVAKPGSSAPAAATRSHASAAAASGSSSCARLPRTRCVRVERARAASAGGCAQNTVCGTKPSARPARSSVRSSSRARRTS